MARILVTNLTGSIGGAERSLLLMVKKLRNQFDMNVACPNSGPLSAELSSMQIQWYKLPSPTKHSYSSPLSLWYWFKTTFRLIKIILKTKPDIIHANSFYAGPASIIASILTRKKLLAHDRDLADFGYLSKLLARSCKKIIAVSYSVRNALVAEGVNPDKIEVIYNGVDNDLPLNLNNTSKTNHNKSDFVFAHVGQFVPWKNHILFLKAAVLVGQNMTNARFLIIGDNISGRDNAYKNSILNYAKNCPIADRIEFLGWQENIDELWRQIDCLVHTAEREPFGRVIIEAMANKIPVVAVDSCGPGEIIQNGKTGILVPADNAKLLCETMLKIAGDKKFADELANAGFECAVSEFTCEQTAGHIKDIYNEVLSA